MRILQLIQAKQYRGAEIFCCQLSNHLIDYGNEVLVVSIYEGFAILPFKNSIISLNRSKKNRFFDIVGGHKLNQIIHDFKPEIIQANAADTLKYAVASKLIFGWSIPIVYRNASASSYYIKDPISKIYNALLLKNVDLIISVSEASKRDLNHLFPFTKSKSLVIPVGVEKTSRITPIYEHFNKNNFNIIHAGSFTKEKNHFGLLNIYKKIKLQYPHVKLHLIGDGELRDKIEMKIKMDNLEDSVFLYGGVNNPISYIAAANVLVLPSLIEGLPGVVLEAMHNKIPVIAYNVGGVNEIITEGTGYLVEKDDEIGFYNSISKIIENPNYEKVHSAYNVVIKKYLNEGLTNFFLKAYSQLLK